MKQEADDKLIRVISLLPGDCTATFLSVVNDINLDQSTRGLSYRHCASSIQIPWWIMP